MSNWGAGGRSGGKKRQFEDWQQLGWSYKISTRDRERKGGLSGEGSEGHRCRNHRAMVHLWENGAL